MTINRSTDGGISQRTNLYAALDMLEHAEPVMVLEKLGKAERMPKNKSTTIKWRRPVPFTAADTPLVEGVTPSGTSLYYEDVSATLTQYGEVVYITDVIEDTHEDPVLKDATMLCGENIGRTLEKLNYGVTRAGTNVFYANGSQRTDVNTPISLSKQRAVTRALKAQKAKMITSKLSSSPNYATFPVEAAWVAVAHTDLESDIRNLAGFKTVAEYGSMKTISPHEIGSCESVRYILSADLDPFADGGGSTSTMVTTSGSNADVYPVMFFGQNSWAHVALRGEGAVEPSIIPVGQKTKDDPLGQRGVVGWKTWWAATILNQLWMARLEVAATDL
jgi:N4-gp56 family major capsid protein